MKISVITVVYNAVNTIEQTILSVISQNYQDVEYIIIDGGSIDGTVDIIKRYQRYIYYWNSSPDKGIYDAMNKGVEVATGNYVFFLGADDWLVDKFTLEKVNSFINKSNADVICGKVYAVIDNKWGTFQKILGGRLQKKDVIKGMMAPHQGMFVKLDILNKLQFNITYKIYADYDLFLRMNIRDYDIRYIDNVISFFSMDGVSSNNYINGYREMKRILKNNEIHAASLYLEKVLLKKMVKIFLCFLGLVNIVKKMVNDCKKHKCDWNFCKYCK